MLFCSPELLKRTFALSLHKYIKRSLYELERVQRHQDPKRICCLCLEVGPHTRPPSITRPTLKRRSISSCNVISFVSPVKFNIRSFSSFHYFEKKKKRVVFLPSFFRFPLKHAPYIDSSSLPVNHYRRDGDFGQRRSAQLQDEHY